MFQLKQINCADRRFYESCYFTGKGVKQAQLQNIQFSRRFIPLQIVSCENINCLFQNSSQFLDEEYIQEILTQENVGSLTGTGNDLLEGAVKLLHDVRKKLSDISEKRIVQLVRRTDVFSFILLCYVVCVKKGSFQFEALEKYVYDMQQYSTAIRQLAENIVFHSQTGFGIMAFRVHDSKSDYMERQYHVKNERKGYGFLEIIVSDFCGDSGTQNIAENFVKKLEDSSLREKFIKLCPASFFMHEDEEDSAWEYFYRNPDNIGKHFGLRIFQSVVTAFGGLFGAESHSGYISQKGDFYLPYESSPGRNCMPGTKYHIVFPIGRAQEAIQKQDLSLDSGINISTNIKTILQYNTESLSVECACWEFQSQEQKNQKISELSVELQRGLDNNYDVLYASIDNVEEGLGEILAKALVMALFRIKRNVRIVLYQCSERIKKGIFDTLKAFFDSTDMEGMFYGVTCQVILYSTEYEETVVDLGSAINTDSINAYISHIKCISSDKWTVGRDGSAIDLNKGATCYVPCDVLKEVSVNGKVQTLFEHYTEMILERNIQNQDFGCKFEHTHMRLGSTIHIENFYEAEILFGNKLFVSRFALLLFKDMRESIENVERLTLYGYGTYSETVLVQMRDMILSYYQDNRDVDYIILEREEERRGFLHKDRIRYNRSFSSDTERADYFADRKLAIVVLINSTLKTHARLIGMFRDENKNAQDRDNEWLIRNYAVILVGNAQGNKYWKLAENKEIQMQTEGVIPIVPAPRYFIQLQVDYKEPRDCDYCFPANPLAEMPLIEVNAASTIPNQAYGIVRHTPRKIQSIDKTWLASAEEKLECLNNRSGEEQQKDLHYNFAYGHIQRNENHFLYYFRTENIWVSKKKKIETALQDWKTQNYREETLQYNVLVAPMHYSNAGFVELVNNTIFQGNAILLRIDFDKEYRCNAYTKFSYLRNYVKQLSSMGTHGVLSVHFIDDSIISGRTFYRAKSLMKSILKIEQEAEGSLEIRIFDKVFVLIDRNSRSSRAQYVKEPERDFYSFLHINISSLRNHGDSCVMCNLKKEADLLGETASTASVAQYWEDRADKFRIRSLEEYDEKKKGRKREEQLKDDAKAVRRLFCTDIAQGVLAEEYHCNDRAMTAYRILNLINTDYESRGSEGYEYFLSYLKCISRPFLVFKRSIKEAIFDILLVIIDAVIKEKAIREVIREVEKEKPYLKERYLIKEFNQLDRNILNDPARTAVDRQDLVNLLMKQLTELKSNYIIRPAKMSAIFKCMPTASLEKFELYYITLICRLVGASSDTNKSIWLDEHLSECDVPCEFKTWISLENTRTLRDGIEKFYIKWNVSKEFQELSEQRITVLKELNELQIAERMFDNFIAKNKAELEVDENQQNTGRRAQHDIGDSIQCFLRKLPVLESINFYDDAMGIRKTGKDWKFILKREQEQLAREKSSKERRQDEKQQGEISLLKKKKSLRDVIDEELDIYQYNNFHKILENENYVDGRKISQSGADMIICCIKILELCRTSDWPILSKVQELTTLFKVILGAEKVQFIVENKAENSLDEWKETIERHFNDLAKDLIEQNENFALHVKTSKQYVLIREQTGTVVCDEELTAETERILDRMEQRKGGYHNYEIDRDSGIVIWKLANKERCIWVSMESAAWQKKDKQDFKVEHDLRKVMMFYQELRQKIFSPENDDYMNEISNARKELNIYNSNRVYTHTKESLLKEQYEQVYKHYTESNKEYDEYYPAYVLKLISDITVSKYYRRGLRKMRVDTEWRQFARWGDLSEFLTDKKEFFYRMDGDEKLYVKLEIPGIDCEEEILCGKDDKDAIRDLTLLIYAIVLNAAQENRGRREAKKENSTVQTAEQRVIVKLVKKEHYLVIQNECAEEVDLEQIKHKLSHVPESEEDGISLWSMNCYLKQCINNLITAMLRRAESAISDNRADNEQDLSELKKWIEKLTGEGFTIQPDRGREQGKTFFAVKIPLFMGGYHCNDTEKGRGEQDDQYCDCRG